VTQNIAGHPLETSGDGFHVVAVVARPGGEAAIRVALVPNRSALDVRLFRRGKPGRTWRPTPAGFRILSDQVPEFLVALEAAVRELGE